MNEQIKNISDTRIREIADKCVRRTQGDFGMIIEGGVDLKKFAELIVQECIIVLDENDGATHHTELLKKHFGDE